MVINFSQHWLRKVCNMGAGGKSGTDGIIRGHRCSQTASTLNGVGGHAARPCSYAYEQFIYFAVFAFQSSFDDVVLCCDVPLYNLIWT